MGVQGCAALSHSVSQRRTRDAGRQRGDIRVVARAYDGIYSKCYVRKRADEG
jgi:ribosomal protein L34E